MFFPWTAIVPATSSFKFVATLTIISCTINVPVFRLKVEITLQPQVSRPLQRLDPRYVSIGNILGSHLASRFVLKCATFLMNRFAEACTTATGRRYSCRSQHRWWFTVDRAISGILEILGLILWILVDLYRKLRARWRGYLWAISATYFDIRFRNLRSFTWKIL